MTHRKLIAGNWKMNGSLQANEVLLREVIAGLSPGLCDVAVCVPAPYLAQAQTMALGSALRVGAQDVSAHDQGAFTGEISAAMLRDFGARYAIVGHSERRQYHGESDALVAQKARAALACGITPIVCVGETLAEREAGRTEEVVRRQLAAVVHLNGHCISEIVVAYEPVWAIGTGKTPTTPEVAAAHAHIRKVLGGLVPDAAGVRLLYGGSVKGSNAVELLAAGDVDGALVGGAALKADEFLAIANAA